MAKASHLSQLLAEIFIVNRVSIENNNKHIIKCLNVHFECSVANKVYIEMPVGESLDKYKIGKPFKVRQELALMFIRGLAELESCNIIHGDIKMENAIVIDGIVKLIDFGNVSTTHSKNKPSIVKQTYSLPIKNKSNLARAFYALAVCIIMIFYDNVASLYQVEAKARKWASKHSKIKILVDMLQGQHPSSFAELLFFFTQKEFLSSSGPNSCQYEPVDLSLLYQLGCKYNINSFVLVNACARLAEISIKKNVIDAQYAYLSLLLTLGLCGNVCTRLEKEYSSLYPSYDILLEFFSFTTAHCFMHDWDTIKLLTFCYPSSQHAVEELKNKINVDILSAVREYGNSINVKLAQVLVIECEMVLNL